MTGHSVVPIGGAPFIRPYSTARALETGILGGAEGYASHHSHLISSSASLTSSPQSQWAPLSPSQSSLPTNSFSSASESGSSSHNNSQLEAALRYSSAIHNHTRKMWEKERMTIEKQKYESFFISICSSR